MSQATAPLRCSIEWEHCVVQASMGGRWVVLQVVWVLKCDHMGQMASVDGVQTQITL